MNILEVACAIIWYEGKILLAQRGPQMRDAGMWEFPGGKLKAGETPEMCIVREIAEELCVRVKPYYQLPAFPHEYADKTVSLIPLLCHLEEPNIRLTEHSQYVFIAPDEAYGLPLMPADVPVLSYFIEKFTQS